MTIVSTGRVPRRTFLQATTGLMGGAVLLAANAQIASAQQEATITFNKQVSDGESVVIASVSSSVDARLLIVTGQSEVFRELQLEAGAEYTDWTVELTNPIQQSQEIRAELRTTEGSDELLARDRALIAVNESLASARATIQLPNGQAKIIEANPEAGFHFPYVLYRPDTAETSPRPLFVISHNDRPVNSREELISQVRQSVEISLGPAIKFRFPGLIPAFPRLPNDGGDLIQSMALPSIASRDPLKRIATDEFPVEALVRVDQQFRNMVDDAMNRLSDESYDVYDQIHMNGFSASAQFAARFAFLYPDRVNAISIGGGGGYPLPRASVDGISLPYPLGTADYQSIRGREFDVDSWKSIHQFIYVGEEDQPLPGSDQRGYYPISYRHEQKAVKVFGENRVTERLPKTKSVYEEENADVTFRVYEGVGHRVTQEMASDFFQFHRNTSRAPNAMVNLSVRRSADSIAVDQPITVFVQVQSRVTTDSRVPITLSVDGEKIETKEPQMQPEMAKELTFEYSFAEPGSHSLRINGLKTGEGPVDVHEPTQTHSETPTHTTSPSETDTPKKTSTGTTSVESPGFQMSTVGGVIGILSYLLKRKEGKPSNGKK